MEKDVFFDIMKKACEKYQEGWYFIQRTDRFLSGWAKNAARWETAEWEKIYRNGIDIRIFSEKGELRLFRGTMADAYTTREIEHDNPERKDMEYFDEDQFLDIDEAATTKSLEEGTESGEEGTVRVRAIGGGEYPLPVHNIHDAKIRIRNYIAYEKETGKAYVSDYRCVGFAEGV